MILAHLSSVSYHLGAQERELCPVDSEERGVPCLVALRATVEAQAVP
jgi:hypothetical protein